MAKALAAPKPVAKPPSTGSGSRVSALHGECKTPHIALVLSRMKVFRCAVLQHRALGISLGRAEVAGAAFGVCLGCVYSTSAAPEKA